MQNIFAFSPNYTTSVLYQLSILIYFGSNLTKRIEKLPTVSFQLPTDDDYYGDGDTELLLLGTSHLKGTEGSVKDCGMEEQEKDDVNLQTDKQLIQ